MHRQRYPPGEITRLWKFRDATKRPLSLHTQVSIGKSGYDCKKKKAPRWIGDIVIFFFMSDADCAFFPVPFLLL
jgi:hypothetical protein